MVNCQEVLGCYRFPGPALVPERQGIQRVAERVKWRRSAEMERKRQRKTKDRRFYIEVCTYSEGGYFMLPLTF